MDNSQYIKLFEKIYTDDFHKIKYFVFSYLKDDSIAEEVAQDSFISLWENRKNVDMEKNILPYLFTCARNQSLNILKRDKHRAHFMKFIATQQDNALNYAALSDSTIDKLFLNDLDMVLEKAIAKMPQNVRDIFIMSRYKGLKNKQIAEITNTTEKSVEYRMFQALKILKDVFKGYIISGILLFRLFY